MYGHKWASQYGECDADETWSIGLAGVTPDQLAAGLRHCLAVGADRARTGDEDWPPTVGEFRGYCKPTRHAALDGFTALPAPELTKEEKLAHIAECRRALGDTE